MPTATLAPPELDPQLAAAEAIETLEAAHDRATLATLATAYADVAEGLWRRSYVVSALSTLKAQRRSYDDWRRVSRSDDVLHDLEAQGLVIYRPDAGDSVQRLRDAASTLKRLASIAAEAAKS